MIGHGRERGFLRGADERNGTHNRVPTRFPVDPDPNGNRAARRAAGPRVEVKVGQVWADNDRRSAGRQVVVVAVGRRQAEVALVDRWGRPWSPLLVSDEQRARPGRRTMIRLDRFRPGSTGYTLVAGPADPCAVCVAEIEQQRTRTGRPVVAFAWMCACDRWCAAPTACKFVPESGQ